MPPDIRNSTQFHGPLGLSVPSATQRKEVRSDGSPDVLKEELEKII